MNKEKIKWILSGSVVLLATAMYYATEVVKNATDLVARKAAGESEFEKFKRKKK